MPVEVVKAVFATSGMSVLTGIADEQKWAWQMNTWIRDAGGIESKVVGWFCVDCISSPSGG